MPPSRYAIYPKGPRMAKVLPARKILAAAVLAAATFGGVAVVTQAPAHAHYVGLWCGEKQHIAGSKDHWQYRYSVREPDGRLLRVYERMDFQRTLILGLTQYVGVERWADRWVPTGWKRAKRCQRG